MVRETRVGRLELAPSLNVNRVVTVHEDIGHCLVREERLQRTQAQNLILDPLDHPLALSQTERCRFFGEQMVCGLADLSASFFVANTLDQREIEYRQQFVINPVFPLDFSICKRLVGVFIVGIGSIFERCICKDGQ